MFPPRLVKAYNLPVSNFLGKEHFHELICEFAREFSYELIH